MTTLEIPKALHRGEEERPFVALGDGMTDVWFAIYGANLNLDADGNVEPVVDAGLHFRFKRMRGVRE